MRKVGLQLEATLHAFQRRQVPCGIVTAGGRMVGSFTVDPGIEASLSNLVEGGVRSLPFCYRREMSQAITMLCLKAVKR